MRGEMSEDRALVIVLQTIRLFKELLSGQRIHEREI
jgi:hypothetical protein